MRASTRSAPDRRVMNARTRRNSFAAVAGQLRTRASHLEQPITCSTGTMRIVFDDGQGGVVIGKGQGEILEINVGALTANASGAFTFTPASIAANNGPLTITIVPVAGTLTI